MIGAQLSRIFSPVIAGAAILLATAALGWLTVTTINGMVADARAEATGARDAHWAKEIALSNALASDEKARQFERALVAEANANARVAELERQLSNMEIENAALPNGDACGLDRDRVRLLAR